MGTLSWLVTSRVGLVTSAAGPVPLVLDLRITHERFGSSSDPSINGHVHYPNDLDRPLNEAAADKIRAYRANYNNRPSNDISYMPVMARLEIVQTLLWILEKAQENWRKLKPRMRKSGFNPF